MKLFNKRYNRRFSYFLGVCVLLCNLGACKKMVEVGQPQGTVTTEKVFSNDADANAALAGIYSLMMSNTGSLTGTNGGISVYAGLSADELSTYQGVNNPVDYQFETNKLLADNMMTSIFWSPLYKTIYSINAALEGVAASAATTLSDSLRTQINGECKFLRAFNYFYLTNIFGDVPLVLSSDFTITMGMARTAQATVYNQMIQDLKDAQALLPGDYSVAGNERIRANKWAATALLARVYLYQKDWKDAQQQAASVIENGQFSLPTDLSQVFLKNSQEAIFQLKPNTTVSPYGIYDASNFIPLLKWTDIPADQRPLYLDPSIFGTYEAYFTPNYYISRELASSFEAGDKRLVQWTSYRETPGVAPYDGVTLYYPFKYTVLDGPSKASTQYYMVLRLAEQYLIRAEAKAQSGDLDGALADINVIRARAGLAPTKAASADEILAAIAQERRVEFFAEWGHRFFDLKRTAKAGTVLGAIAAKQPWDDRQLVYPIPVTEIQAAPQLIQNPGF